METEMKIGHITITKVHPDMVRILDDKEHTAITVKEDDFTESMEVFVMEMS